jgi:hypothetical protein
MQKISYILIIFSFFSCKTDNENPTPEGEVQIRVWNGSNYEYDEVFVDTNGGQNDFGNLVPGNRSDYKQFKSAYRYAFVSFKIKGKAYSIQPIDYVGEELLLKGKYTYKISVDNPDSQYALLEFIED